MPTQYNESSYFAFCNVLMLIFICSEFASHIPIESKVSGVSKVTMKYFIVSATVQRKSYIKTKIDQKLNESIAIPTVEFH